VFNVNLLNWWYSITLAWFRARVLKPKSVPVLVRGPKWDLCEDICHNFWNWRWLWNTLWQRMLWTPYSKFGWSRTLSCPPFSTGLSTSIHAITSPASLILLGMNLTGHGVAFDVKYFVSPKPHWNSETLWSIHDKLEVNLNFFKLFCYNG